MAGRRSYGSGSLIEEKQRTGRVVWIGQVRVGGKQKQRTLGPKAGPGALTKRQAEAALRAFRDEAEASAAAQAQTPTSRVSLGAVAAQHLQHLESNGTKASTIADYKGYLEGHLVPYFGDVPMRDIRVRHVEEFIAHQQTKAVQKRFHKSGPNAGKPKVGLHGSTVSNHVNYLSAIYSFAQRHEYVETNPVSPAKKPRVKKQHQDFSFLTPAEVDAVLRAVKDDYLGQTDRTIIETAAWSGLRLGELRALRWKDVLWTDAVIVVRASISRGTEGDTKSESSSREVPLEDRVARALELHFQASAYKTDDDYVFAHPQTGRSYDESKLRDRFYDAMRAAGFEHMIGRDGGGITFHSLRHTFGTQMVSADIPIVAVKDWMGHADIQTTMIYAKWGKKRQADRALVNAARLSAEAQLDGSITDRPSSVMT